MTIFPRHLPLEDKRDEQRNGVKEKRNEEEQLYISARLACNADTCNVCVCVCHGPYFVCLLFYFYFTQQVEKK